MRILLVRLRQIGDVVFTTPAVRAVRERFPDATITYLVEPAAAPVVDGNPDINELVVAPRLPGLAGWKHEWSLIRRLRAKRFDVVIDFHGGPRASLITWLSGAPMRIGYAVIGRGWMYTHSIGRPRALRARHSVENQWDLLAPLGVAAPDPTAHPVTMPVNPAAADDVNARLFAAGVNRTDLLVIMHVSAGNPFRRWPIPAFAEVALGLAGRGPSCRIVVTSGPSERAAADMVIAAARAELPERERERILSCGEFSLSELRALVERAALYIGGDSGPMHIASTSHVSMVSLYGPTLPARSAPWRAPNWPARAVEIDGLPCRPCQQRVCIPGDFRCLTWIRPEQVLAAAEHALSLASR
jgi:predicted lipopolysaccharide heptosyltransferase III